VRTSWSRTIVSTVSSNSVPLPRFRPFNSDRLVGGVQYSKESQTIVVIMLHPGYFAYLPAAQRHLYPVYLLQQELYYMAREEVLTSNSSPNEIAKGKSPQTSRLVDRVVHRRTVGILHSYLRQMER
jgi:hypothetical protein